jgi:hypothetical protein
MMQKILGAIERGGNKMPNPAILFVWLCVIVIIVSALLAWADIKVTYQVVEAPPVPVEEVVQGGSTQPSGGLPDASVQEGEWSSKDGGDPEPLGRRIGSCSPVVANFATSWPLRPSPW